MRLLITFIILVCFLNSNIFSQNHTDVFNVKYNYSPDNQLINTKTNVSLKDLQTSLDIPFELKTKNYIGIKLNYNYFNINSKSSQSKNLTLNSFKLSFNYLLKHKNEKWTSYFEINSKINSDFKKIELDHFQYGGVILNFYEKNSDFFWQFGIFYNQETYGPFIVPLIGFDWKPSSKTYLLILLPARLTFEYEIPKTYGLYNLYTGIDIELIGDTYRLGGSEFKNSFINQTGENKLTFLTKTTIFLDAYISKHLVVYLKPGIRFFQKYEHFTEDDQIITNSDYLQGELKNSFYTEIGLSYRFRYDED